ncbi:hypothetical protein SAMN04487949_1302 [Halogranum gelatinilyticum]|uniref:Uncharacterized protein n=1 Tax=Halogranum gelatinilyticum TaxID=660521 RepID=A0A1G9RE81_9EURY|nr:DR2241 family protein [Halogranum gelatinilyticum]SDM21558.1 hypothetical protein SAMN04487949_1302 [Halogranum gelatinilyticum]
MQATQLAALRDAAEDGPGVQFDGLYVHAGDEDYDRDGGYSFGTPEGEQSGLSQGEFEDAAEQYEAYVTNWYFWTHVVGGSKLKGGVDVGEDHHHRRGFLRWLELADQTETDVPGRYESLREGITHEWGEIRITATLGDEGARVYEIRHVDDAEVAAEELDSYTDPLDLRELVKHDDRGRYRPLRTAPTLQTGWVLTDLDQRQVFEAVDDVIYPATVVNWNLERHGDLDVTHWEETIGRQSGIYGVVKTWNRGEGHEHVDWVAEACCDDSQCIKRREWQYDEDTELAVDGGDGVFPCREPCSLVISASRKWTRLEGEETKTYEFELTESEKEQVEDVIDAVADGRADEIREADIYKGANRYRTRFLRAKRFDEEGNLSGTPTVVDDGHEETNGDAERDAADDADED